MRRRIPFSDGHHPQRKRFEIFIDRRKVKQEKKKKKKRQNLKIG